MHYVVVDEMEFSERLGAGVAGYSWVCSSKNIGLIHSQSFKKKGERKDEKVGSYLY